MAFTPAQHREYRKRLKERGVCVRCHKKPARDGLATCEGCKQASTKWLTQAKKKWRSTPHVCGSCGQDSGEYSYCERCRKSRARGRRMWKKRAIEDGRCGNCGREMGAPGWYCPICADAHYRRVMMRRAIYGRAATS